MKKPLKKLLRKTWKSLKDIFINLWFLKVYFRICRSLKIFLKIAWNKFSFLFEIFKKIQQKKIKNFENVFKKYIFILNFSRKKFKIIYFFNFLEDIFKNFRIISLTSFIKMSFKNYEKIFKFSEKIWGNLQKKNFKPLKDIFKNPWKILKIFFWFFNPLKIFSRNSLAGSLKICIFNPSNPAKNIPQYF